MSTYDVLKKMSRDYFPPEKSKNTQKDVPQLDLSKFPEAKIDSTKLEKDHEMERLQKVNKNQSPVSTDTGKPDRVAYSSTDNYDLEGSYDSKPGFSGLTSNNIRPSAGPVKKVRPINRAGANI